MLLVGAVITAFYTTRMVLKTFHGEYRGTEHLHESPRSMTAPLVFLAAATCVVGFLGFAPTGAPFMDWVYFGGVPETPVFGPLVAAISVLAVAIGLLFGYSDVQGLKAVDPITELGWRRTPCSSTSTTWTTSTCGGIVRPDPRPCVGRRVLVQPTRARRRGERGGGRLARVCPAASCGSTADVIDGVVERRR